MHTYIWKIIMEMDWSGVDEVPAAIDVGDAFCFSCV